MKSYILIIFFYLNIFTLQAQNIQILFDYNKYVLNEQEIQRLNALLDTVNIENFETIHLAGHTDNIGTSDKNFVLAQKRALYLQELLTNKGISKNIIQIKVFGETQALANNNTEEGRKQNRCVEISLTFKKQEVITTTTEKIISKNYENISNLYKQLSRKSQFYKINPNKDTIIVSDKNTIFYIKKNSFKLPKNIQVADSIYLEIKVDRLKSEMLQDRLHTMSNKNLLMSDGMFKFLASINGQILDFQKDVVVFLPTQEPLSKPQFFEGNGEENAMNWELAENNKINVINYGDYLSYGNSGGGGSIDSNCRFFFCRIGFFFRRLFGIRSGNLGFNRNFESPYAYEDIRNIMEEYGIDDYEDAIEILNQSLYKTYGVDNYRDLQKAIKKEKIENIKVKYLEKEISFNELQYYVMGISKRSETGWYNIDQFMKQDMIAVVLNEKPNTDKSIQAIFKSRNVIVNSMPTYNNYTFRALPKGKYVTFLALKYEDRQAYLAIEEGIVGRKKDFSFNFKPVSLEELETQIRKYNL